MVDGVAHERVDEAGRRLGPDDLGADQLARGRRDRTLVDPGERGDAGQVGALAQHRGGARHRAGVVREAGEPQQHRARHRARADRADDRRLLGDGLHALRLERAQELAQQQRVAAGGGMAGGAERGLGGVAEPLAHERRGRGLAERSGPQRERRGILDDLGEQARVGARLGAAQRRGDEHRGAVEPPREVGEEAQRRAVGPVQVVDREQDGMLRREVEREPVERVQRGERGGALLVGGRRGLEQRGGRGGGAGELPARGDPRLEELAHDAVGELALELPGAGLDDLQRRLRALAQAREQARLADPRRALDQDEPAAARGRARDELVERGQLGVAFEQQGGGLSRQGRHRPGRARVPRRRSAARPRGAGRRGCPRTRRRGRRTRARGSSAGGCSARP